MYVYVEKVDLGNAVRVSGVVLGASKGNRVKVFTVEYTEDGTVWNFYLDDLTHKNKALYLYFIYYFTLILILVNFPVNLHS